MPAVNVFQKLDIAPAYRQVADSVEAMITSGRLSPGDWLRGPLLVVEDQTTTVAPPAFDVSVDAYGYLVLDRRPAEGARS